MTDEITQPPQTAALPVPHWDTEAELDKIALRMRRARGPAMQLLTLLGGQAESLLGRLPTSVQSRLGSVTAAALEAAFDAAAASRTRRLPDTSDWLTRALTMGTGAAGGFGGLPSALAELPVTTTVLLRAIQGIAAEYNIDPNTPEGRNACLRVFAAAGPLTDDDGTDLSFVTLRVTVTGASVHSMIAKVAPQLSVALGQKLAAQTVPVIGAAAGAATNYIFTTYYQDMAHVQFALMRLSAGTGKSMEELTAGLRDRLLPAKGV